MQKLARFWRSLESVPGLAAVTIEWKALLGPAYDQVQGFFRPNGRQATSYPCTQEPDCGCYHEVIEHAPDDIVAACRCEPKRCDTFKVTRADIAIYELDRKALCAAIASALQIQPDFAPVEDMWQTYLIGHYAPYAGFRFPVFLTIQIEPDEFQQVVQGLVAENDGPFILLSPTRELSKAGCEKLLQKRKSCFLCLDEIMVLKEDSTLAANLPAEEVLAEFRAAVLPEERDSAAPVFFPTPAGATWQDVNIKFIDGHTVSIKVNGEEGVYNYTQMGMVDKRNGDPTKQWDLLYSFAQGHGTMDYDHPDACQKNQKRKEKLAKCLCDFFGIQEDPFRLTDDRKGWRARFLISPD